MIETFPRVPARASSFPKQMLRRSRMNLFLLIHLSCSLDGSSIRNVEDIGHTRLLKFRRATLQPSCSSPASTNFSALATFSKKNHHHHDPDRPHNISFLLNIPSLFHSLTPRRPIINPFFGIFSLRSGIGGWRGLSSFPVYSSDTHENFPLQKQQRNEGEEIGGGKKERRRIS